MNGPRLAVSAVVVAEGRVLLVRRARPPYRGRWAFPGGRVAPGETLAAAVRREVREECGLAVRVGGLLDVVEVRAAPDAPAAHWVILAYRARPTGGRPSAGDDAAELAWLTLAELADRPTAPGVAALAARALAGAVADKAGPPGEGATAP
jgi:8-oxo-dGTP diphosphatase